MDFLPSISVVLLPALLSFICLASLRSEHSVEGIALTEQSDLDYILLLEFWQLVKWMQVAQLGQSHSTCFACVGNYRATCNLCLI